MNSADFPIAPLLPAIRDSLAAHPRLVLEAPPGAGKTTQVPLALLDAPWLHGKKILMLEPRRIAARAAAGFMAKQRGEDVGATIGYRIRFEARASAATRIEVVTEGILTRLIQDDPELSEVGAILFDEFHERQLHGDLGLALALDVQAQLRPDLRLVLMSATLDGERLAQFLDAPRLTAEGRSFPVRIAYPPRQGQEPAEAQLKRAVQTALAETDGDVLVFLPGQREIAQTERLLAGAIGADLAIVPLHGELSLEQQSAALAPDALARRRIVLATNVAESSVTLPNVRAVVDTGLAREPRFDPNSGFSRLETVTISQASADQRAGRAGRVAAGVCYRLWPQSQRLEPSRRPEIAQVELSALLLELRTWGDADLRFVDPPPPGAMAQAEELLRQLGALDVASKLTALGRRLLALGTHPRLAAMLASARAPRDAALACDLVSLIEARDPLRGPARRRDDLASRWQALAAFRAGRTPPDADRGALAAIDQAAKQWRRRLRIDAMADGASAHELGDVVMHAFPDRIARQLTNAPRRYQLANGRGARLFDDSVLYGEPWLVISELRLDDGDSLIQRAAPLDLTRLEREFPARFIEEDVVRWDADARAVTAQRVRRFDRLLLESKPLGKPDPGLCRDALLDGVRTLGLAALPWTESQQQWRARVASLRSWMPDLDLPDVSDAALLAGLDDWLGPFLAGKTRLSQLAAEELGEALRASLDHARRQALERYAPAAIRVPSGMERRIEYALDAPPVLAVKLQELFGLADGPRVADGRRALVLHLLSPAGRPLQVTQDLKGFWERTYPEVKKEMKGRYPKHPWPDDPWSAAPTHRAKPRGT
ncbi:MAG: ATP-dependent helicase HrpB [Chiayiivirga sp.]|uniref:ATP-dependent helicase HrpB n=1 Tax=Chiayiivirga sp. TaxID=2041042 RepID=UPI0025C6E034|nr:ATP-dependent helicase HrpB [Chiayiivirga sp.]MCI1727873.1 ATP-dependent helicase HrpB [Chiayiivirga sp.]